MAQMSSFERISMALKGEEPDRVPIGWLGHLELGIGLPQVKVSEVVRDKTGQKLFEGIKAVYERYKPDAITVFTYTLVEAVAIGTKPRYYDDLPPGPLEYVVKEPSDLDRLKMPDPRYDGDLPCIYNAIKMVVEEYGNKAPVSSNVVGPFSVAARIRGLWEIAYDIMRRPWFVHDLLEFTTEACIGIAERYAEQGIRGLGYGAGSETTISPEQYLKFVLPYDRRFVKALRKMGLSVSRHICSGPTATGPSAPLLIDEFAKAGVDGPFTLWGFYRMPEEMLEKKRTIKHMTVGGSARVSLLEHGKPEEIIDEVSRWIKKVAPGGRYIFIGDCGIPTTAPLSNVDIWVKTAKEVGKYPIKE